MRHAFIDTYADLNTPLHRLNAKTKIIFLIVFLSLIIFSSIRYIALFLLYALVTIVLVYLSKLPLRFMFERITKILPLVIIISFSALFKRQGYILFLNCIVKATLAIILVLVTFSTARFNHLLAALKQLKVPSVFIYLLSFMYRYSFLLEDQLLRARRAYESRNINPAPKFWCGVNNKNNFKKVKILSNILGTIFIRTYERAERIYLAMCSRGYNNEKSS